MEQFKSVTMVKGTHLTGTERKRLLSLFNRRDKFTDENGAISGKIGQKKYWIKNEHNGIYDVCIAENRKTDYGKVWERTDRYEIRFK